MRARRGRAPDHIAAPRRWPRVGMRTTVRLVTLVASVITPVATLAAQEARTLSVRVGDERGGAVAGATVRFDGLAQLGRTTDAGVATITVPECGTRTIVTARATDHATASRRALTCWRDTLPLLVRSLASLAGLTGGGAGGAVLGRVRDVRGAPLAGATVRLGGAGLEATTDSLGRFGLTGVAAGSYLLRVRAPGRVMAQLGFDLAPREVREFLLQLDDMSVTLPRDSARLLAGDDGTDAQLHELEARRGARGDRFGVSVSRETLLAHEDGRRILGCTLSRVPDVWRLFPEFTPGRCLDFNPCVTINGRMRANLSLAMLPADRVEFVELHRSFTEYTAALGEQAPGCAVQARAVLWLRTDG